MFGTHGLRGTSIAAIARRLGLTDSGVHHYFPTKDALVDAVIERAVQLQTTQMQSLVRPGGLEAIRNMAGWGEILEQTPELVALQVVLSTEAILDNSAIGDQIRRRYDAVQDLAAGLIREGIERGEIRADIDADWEASSLIAYLDGIRLQWLYSDRQLPVADRVRQYFDLVVHRLERGDSKRTHRPR
jgi:AcrR family transcriptional regulator